MACGKLHLVYSCKTHLIQLLLICDMQPISPTTESPCLSTSCPTQEFWMKVLACQLLVLHRNSGWSNNKKVEREQSGCALSYLTVHPEAARWRTRPQHRQPSRCVGPLRAPGEQVSAGRATRAPPTLEKRFLDSSNLAHISLVTPTGPASTPQS